jgi:hypothetical protein
MARRGKFITLIWLNAEEAKSRGLKWKGNGGSGRKGKQAFVSTTDPIIPQAVRFECFKEKIAAENNIKQRKNSILATSDIEDYSHLPVFQRKKIDYCLAILRATDGLKGKNLEAWVQGHNQQNPEQHLSCVTLYKWRKKEREYGVYSLAPDYGKRKNSTCVLPELSEYFKSAFFKEGAPSVHNCWLQTRGYAEICGYDVNNFPSPISFFRDLKKKYGAEALYYARYGMRKNNRKYADYIDRGYDNVRAGQCYVSDHHQLDVMVKLPNGKYIRPWITIWRDFKSGKWLSWLLHIEPPNSDHIFQTLYSVILNFGVPAEIVIDNGKDYKCRDLRGNKSSHRVTVDEKTRSGLFATLGIIVHYCLPYRAQSKPIERDFRTLKEGFSKFQLLYTGGSPQEKPESNNPDMKAGKGDSLEDLNGLFDTHVKDVLNKIPSKYSKNLIGMCRDEAFEKDRITPRYVNPDSLMLLCTRTSKPLTIGRNGPRDGALKITYWAEWMQRMKGEKVYLRRDSNHFEEAWVFDLADRFIGKASLVRPVPALAKTPVEKAQLSAAMKAQRARAKATKKLAEVENRPSPAETIKNMAAGVAAINEQRGYISTGKEVEGISMLTPADGVIKQAAEMEARGTYSLAGLAPPKPEEKVKIFKWGFEKTEAEENRKREGKSHG